MLPNSVRHHHVVLFLFALLVFVRPAAADTTRLLSWNVLNYPNNSGASRSDDFRVVLGDLQPDIVVMQEINDSNGASTMKTDVFDVLEPNTWSLAPFTNGNDSDNALYFRSNQYVVVEFGEVSTWPRETDWWRLRLAESDPSSPGIVIYSTHLKASQGTTEAEERRVAARAIRDDMIFRWGDSGQPVFVVGDFNIYTSLEPAYGALTGNPGELQQMFDPIDTPGSWNNNSLFADVHTQSTRTTNLGDGGSTGGMDDRFDFILVDADLQDGEAWDYVPGSYRAVGQDGARFNSTVNAGTNGDVSATVADALYFASDHLPIVVDLQEPAQAQFLPTSFAFGDVLQGESLLEVFQLRNTALAPVDDLDFVVTATEPGTGLGGTTSGSLASGQVANVNVSIDTDTPRVFTGGLQLTTDDPGRSNVLVPFEGAVVRPSAPSLVDSTVVTARTIALEDVTTETATIAFDVANVGADEVQAGVYVSSTTIGGLDAARFTAQDPAAYFVRETPVERRFEVDLSGLSPGETVTATVTLAVQDDFLVDGWQFRGQLVATLSVTVANEATDAPAAAITRTTLRHPTPSPFNPRTTIAFDLARSGDVTLEVLDVRGRRVRTIVAGERLGAGTHTHVWNGTDDAGRPLASGVYLVRLRAADVVEVRRAVLVR